MNAPRNDLKQFRPLSDEMKYRVRNAIRETTLMLAKEQAYHPENQNASYMLYLRNLLRMLENELSIAGS